jgi:hypothetical protein
MDENESKIWNSLDIGKIALYNSNINDITLQTSDSKVRENINRKIYLSLVKKKELETSKDILISVDADRDSLDKSETRCRSSTDNINLSFKNTRTIQHKPSPSLDIDSSLGSIGKKKTFDLFDIINPKCKDSLDERKTTTCSKRVDNYFYNNINITAESLKFPILQDDKRAESITSLKSGNSNNASISPFRLIATQKLGSSEVMKKYVDKPLQRNTTNDYFKSKVESNRNKETTSPSLFIGLNKLKDEGYWNNGLMNLSTPETVRNSTTIKNNIEFLPKLIGDDEVDLKSDGDD